MDDFDAASRVLSAEVDREAVELLRAGVAPWRAMGAAVENVLRRRSQAVREQRKAQADAERST
jgi:hypothetical protein